MQSQTESWVAVAIAADERRCAELALVLTARGIDSERVATVAGWQLLVRASNAAAAVAELAAYRSENARPTGSRRVEEIGAGWRGVLAYCGVLLAIFIALRASPLGLDWYGAGRLEAGRVVAGEWWRVVTALTMHIELDHLAGNLAFGAFFGYFVGRYLGGGVGWLTIVAGGAAGNLLNALVQSPAHRSIGASTAVFAMLGLLTAYTWRRGFLQRTPWRARIAPIVAGIALLAFTGTGGENTDLFAHLTGFVAGFGAGVVLARLATVAALRRRAVQVSGGALAALAVVLAWIVALAVAG
jgi:rhomboid protease GluP